MILDQLYVQHFCPLATYLLIYFIYSIYYQFYIKYFLCAHNSTIYLIGFIALRFTSP